MKAHLRFFAFSATLRDSEGFSGASLANDFQKRHTSRFPMLPH